MLEFKAVSEKAVRGAAVALVGGASLLGQTVSMAQDAGGNLSITTPVVVIVKVPTPWYAPRALVVSKMRDTIPEYESLPALSFKAFSFARESGDFGGIYLWRDRAAAQAWFSPAWHERVRQQRGNSASVRMFDAPLTIDNTPGGTPASANSQAVATLVELNTPPGVSRERLLQEFEAAAPAYRQIPGLLRKHFIITEAGGFGGIYLWRDDASARAWFNARWQEQVRAKYGQDARMEWFDTPILTPHREKGRS